jgi:hypothetical protein
MLPTQQLFLEIEICVDRFFTERIWNGHVLQEVIGLLPIDSDGNNCVHLKSIFVLLVI